jgi:hypothetical protein
LLTWLLYWHDLMADHCHVLPSCLCCRPAHVYSYSSNTGYPGPHMKRVIRWALGAAGYINLSCAALLPCCEPWCLMLSMLPCRLRSYIRETWPFFNRSGGKDHAMW